MSTDEGPDYSYLQRDFEVICKQPYTRYVPCTHTHAPIDIHTHKHTHTHIHTSNHTHTHTHTHTNTHICIYTSGTITLAQLLQWGEIQALLEDGLLQQGEVSPHYYYYYYYYYYYLLRMPPPCALCSLHLLHLLHL
jgi:hypothetical protein